jgi:hypothetical protein
VIVGHTDPVEVDYRCVKTYRTGERIALGAFPDVAVDVAAVIK